MKLTDLTQKSKKEQTSILHDATRGWDKHLVMELVNEYNDEIHNILSSKYKTYEQDEDEGTIYANKYYFNYYEYVCHELYINKQYWFFDVPSHEIGDCWKLFDAIEILENTLIDTLPPEDLEKLSPNRKNPLKTSKNDHFDYCEIGVLFAQGFIKKVVNYSQRGFDYFYKEKSFKSSTELEKYLQKHDIVTVKSIRQYIDGTLGPGDDLHNLYIGVRAKNVEDYCKLIPVTPTAEWNDEVKRFKLL